MINVKYDEKIEQILNERFGHDTLLSVATVEDGKPFVRIVDSFYEKGAFYVVTYSLSKKMKHIAKNATVAICGEWFSGHGIGENLGWVLDEKNAMMMSKLRAAFAAWYDNGHTDESDKNTCLLKITLTDAILFAMNEAYNVSF